MSDREFVNGNGRDDPAGATPLSGPRVFVSYRIADTVDLVTQLSERLRDDLGSRSVFRDKDSLIGGQPWQDVIDDALTTSDVVLFVVGPHWSGTSDSGRRIDEPTDPVRHEVSVALETKATIIPILVDLDAPPTDLDEHTEQLFTRHAIRTTRENLLRTTSGGYQATLVAVWEGMRTRVPNGVLVMTDVGDSVDLERFVEELQSSRLVDARQLSRLAAGVHLASGRRLRRWSRRLPDVIVRADGPPSPLLSARLAAVADHPSLERVALVGIGAAGALSATAVASAGGRAAYSASTHVDGLGSFGSSRGTAFVRRSATRWARLGLGAKAAVVAGTVGVGVASVAATQWSTEVDATVRYGYLDVTLDEARTVAAAVDEISIDPADLGDDERLVAAGLTIENTAADLEWRIDTDEVFRLQVGDAVYPPADGERIDLPVSATTQTVIPFVVPDGVNLGDADLIVQESPEGVDDRTRPAQLAFDGSRTDDIPEFELVNVSGSPLSYGGCEVQFDVHSIRVGDEAGHRANGGAIWNPDWDNRGRLARPRDGRLFATVIGETTKQRPNCSLLDISAHPPVVLDVDDVPRDPISSVATLGRSWSREPSTWIWTFEVDEDLTEFRFVIPDLDDIGFEASVDAG
ncbi:MAG: toll/interleukin-1 receptor domain-containing protein [Ilumatobacteraceae bacterium]